MRSAGTPSPSSVPLLSPNTKRILGRHISKPRSQVIPRVPELMALGLTSTAPDLRLTYKGEAVYKHSVSVASFPHDITERIPIN